MSVDKKKSLYLFAIYIYIYISTYKTRKPFILITIIKEKAHNYNV
jgi:hypothetical protein